MIECVENKEDAMKLVNFDHSFSIYKPTYEEVCAASSICPNISELKVTNFVIIFIFIYYNNIIWDTKVNTNDESLPLFSILDKVENATVELDGDIKSGMEMWLTNSGPRLRSIDLTTTTDITWKQLVHVAECCTNMRRFKYTGQNLIWDQGAFSGLSKFVIL
jgi:hypothetical protein